MMSILSGAGWREQPTLVREMRVQMRGARAYWLLLLYLGIVSLVALGFYWAFLTQITSGGSSGSNQTSTAGTTIFISVVVTQLFLTLFITPAITSGAITSEKERQTLELLLTTPMTRGSIVMGKLLASFGFTMLLQFSALPILALGFLLGGVDPEMVFSIYLLLIAVNITLASLGLMWSSIARNTVQATILVYATLFFFGLNPLLGGSLFFSAMSGIFSTLGGAGMFPPAFQGFTAFLKIPETIGRFMANGDFGMQPFGRGIMGLGMALYLLLVSGALLSVATARIQTYPDRNALNARLFTAAASCLVIFGTNRIWMLDWYHRNASGVQTIAASPIFALGTILLFLSAIVQIFTTGDIAIEQEESFWKYLVRSFKFKNLRIADPGSGFAYTGYLLLVWAGIYPVSEILYGRFSDFLHGFPTYILAVGGLYAVYLAYSSFGLLMSLLTRNRWLALFLLYFIPSVIWNVLSPFFAFNIHSLTWQNARYAALSLIGIGVICMILCDFVFRFRKTKLLSTKTAIEGAA